MVILLWLYCIRASLTTDCNWGSWRTRALLWNGPPADGGKKYVLIKDIPFTVGGLRQPDCSDLIRPWLWTFMLELTRSCCPRGTRKIRDLPEEVHTEMEFIFAQRVEEVLYTAISWLVERMNSSKPHPSFTRRNSRGTSRQTTGRGDISANAPNCEQSK
jgi:hypothetical protein